MTKLTEPTSSSAIADIKDYTKSIDTTFLNAMSFKSPFDDELQNVLPEHESTKLDTEECIFRKESPMLKRRQSIHLTSLTADMFNMEFSPTPEDFSSSFLPSEFPDFLAIDDDLDESATSCHICFKSFASKTLLKSHMFSHSTVKQFGCNECGNKYGRASDLSRHQKSHDTAKQKECPDCKKKFTRKDVLKRHRKTSICKRRASTPDLLLNSHEYYK